MAELLDYLIRLLRRMTHVFVPYGTSPEKYRRLMQAMHKQLVYDPQTQTVTVKKGKLAGAKKYGPFCDADFDFALGRYETEVTAAFDRYCRPGMTVFDVGAHAGHHTILLSKLCGVSGHVHAFEPVPQNVECLRETLRLNNLQNVSVHELAVSDREGEARLKCNGVFDGFACLAEGGHGRTEFSTTASTVLTVRTIDVDTFCNKFGIARIDLIKMDIEGAEMLALRGMTRTLRRRRPVLILELWGCEHIAEAPGFLGGLGYETRTLSTWQGYIQGAFAETSNVLALPISVT